MRIQCISRPRQTSVLPTTGTLFSDMHAMTQALQPVHAFKSMTIPHWMALAVVCCDHSGSARGGGDSSSAKSGLLAVLGERRLVRDGPVLGRVVLLRLREEVRLVARLRDLRARRRSRARVDVVRSGYTSKPRPLPMRPAFLRPQPSVSAIELSAWPGTIHTAAVIDRSPTVILDDVLVLDPELLRAVAGDTMAALSQTSFVTGPASPAATCCWRERPSTIFGQGANVTSSDPGPRRRRASLVDRRGDVAGEAGARRCGR
jgi:hypothetical protein